jgi:diguanylate cyclase (GGDEF)-like protein/PAS domain S-box-containing protein
VPDLRIDLDTATEAELRAEIVRLNKVVNALADRAERSMRGEDTESSIFQTRLLLERHIQERTAELEASFRENQKVYRSLQESESRFRGLVNQSLVGIGVIEGDYCIYSNLKLASMFGYTVEEILHCQLAQMVPPEDLPRVSEQLQRRFRHEADESSFHFVGRRKDGTLLDVESHAQVMEMDGKPVLITMMIDITERMQEQREIAALQERLQEQAIRDPLTGLYNRLSLNEFFDRELHVALRAHRPVSLILADLDHFKQINDTWGHLAGDKVLVEFSQLLQGACRASDLCCRYGGEEFMVLLPDMALEQARLRTEFIRTILERAAVPFGETEIRTTGSFGVAMFPDHGQTREQLIAAADRALYRAKNNGRNQVQVAVAEDTETVEPGRK